MLAAKWMLGPRLQRCIVDTYYAFPLPCIPATLLRHAANRKHHLQICNHLPFHKFNAHLTVQSRNKLFHAGNERSHLIPHLILPWNDSQGKLNQTGGIQVWDDTTVLKVLAIISTFCSINYFPPETTKMYSSKACRNNHAENLPNLWNKVHQTKHARYFQHLQNESLQRQMTL